VAKDIDIYSINILGSPRGSFQLLLLGFFIFGETAVFVLQTASTAAWLVSTLGHVIPNFAQK
jgi:hypothetical protein